MTTEHSDKRYERELRTLREKLIAMGARIEEQMALSFRALVDRNDALVGKVLEHEEVVDRMEMEVDELCRRMLALRQPAASDLRFITTALKLVVDLERIGDLSVSISRLARALNAGAPVRSLYGMSLLAERSRNQVKRALDALVHNDVQMAEEVLAGDRSVDEVFRTVFDDLLHDMSQDSTRVASTTSLLSVAKHLERIGDHAVNVAEMVVFLVRGTDVRHPHSRPRDDVPRQ